MDKPKDLERWIFVCKNPNCRHEEATAILPAGAEPISYIPLCAKCGAECGWIPDPKVDQ